MERLSALDASFLYLESERTPMHISSLAIYEGPAPTNAQLRDMLERRLPLVPRFRQKLASTPFGLHRPVWIDDEDFDLDAHLAHVALFEPREEALLQLSGRILSQPLCKTRPLWEMWMISGLPRGRFAILSKTHHCLWDGIAGIDLHSVLLDDSPDGRPTEDIVPFKPRANPSGLGMLARAARDRLNESIDVTNGLINAVRDPVGAYRQARSLVRDVSSFTGSLLKQAPNSSLNTTIGARRRYALGRASLTDVKGLKPRFGASVNDVVLAAVAGGLREWQLHRDVTPHDMRVMVPVSVRGENTDLGNRVAMVVVQLPVADKTPAMRLERVHRTMTNAKESGHVAAGETITRLSSFMPPMGVAALTRAQAVMRPFNLLVTNIPGPQMPLYLLGRKLVELFPQAPLATDQGLSIAALSYDNKIGFGLLADHDILPDVEVIAAGIESSLDDLLIAGGARKVEEMLAATEREREFAMT